MTRSNPLGGLVEILAALAAVRDSIPQFSDAAVVDPVVPTVRLAGAESAAEPLEVLSLAPPAELKAGSRVLILHRGGQLVLLGRTYGTPSATPVVPAPTPDPDQDPDPDPDPEPTPEPTPDPDPAPPPVPAPSFTAGTLSTSTTPVLGRTVTYHVAAPGGSAARGMVVYFDGDGMAKVSSITATLSAMAAEATKKGFVFVAPKSPFSNVQWWDSADSQHDEVARAFIDWAAEKWGAAQLHLVGYSGGTVLLDKDLLNTGTWPGQYIGGALHFGGGSSTNTVSTPTAWRAGWPMRYVVGNRDIAGATVPADWSAKAAAERAKAKYEAAGHPASITYTDDDHGSYAFASHLAAYLPAIPTA